jgi:pectin methylesterase-like acyl-CoA thioesterase
MCKKITLLTLPLLVAVSACNEQPVSNVKMMPQDGAVDVCPDTHLTLTFAESPTLGDSGMIRIFDAESGVLVDSLDLSIPAGPTKPRTYGPDCDYTKIPYDYARTSVPTNRDTRPGTPSGTAEPTPPDYQLTIIGGFTDAFHFYPVIVHDSVATIYPHNNMLEYGHTYNVQVDASVFRFDSLEFKGIAHWKFSTKAAAPTGNRVTVDASGKGDFCTVQGALDYVPDSTSEDYFIDIAAGDYEELVYARNKTHLHLKGAGMQWTRVHYANCEVFNPHPLTVKTNEVPGTFPSRRAAFMLDNCQDVTIEDMAIATDMRGQAEALLLNGEHIALRNVEIIGSGDAMQVNGSVYMEDCWLAGGGDTFLGRGPLFAYRCMLNNDGGPFTWVRNTKGHHGFVFVECTFNAVRGRPVDLGRCPDNHGKGYPYAEQVLINCKVTKTIPEGWSAIGQKTACFMEYNTCDIVTGKPVDTSKRHRWSRQLTKKDAKIIENYSTPAFVLKGWTPTFD